MGVLGSTTSQLCHGSLDPGASSWGMGASGWTKGITVSTEAQLHASATSAVCSRTEEFPPLRPARSEGKL